MLPSTPCPCPSTTGLTNSLQTMPWSHCSLLLGTLREASSYSSWLNILVKKLWHFSIFFKSCLANLPASAIQVKVAAWTTAQHHVSCSRSPKSSTSYSFNLSPWPPRGRGASFTPLNCVSQASSDMVSLLISLTQSTNIMSSSCGWKTTFHIF